MWRIALCCAVMVVVPVSMASGQMVVTHSPLQHNGASFYEYSHIGWSIQNPHYFMRFNGGGGVPPFGGYTPNSGLHGGFSTGHSQFDFGFGQGATLTSSTVTPFITTTNGYPGYMFIGSQRPFVTGVAPVVGGGFAGLPPAGPPIGPLALRMATGQLQTSNGRIKPQGLDEAELPPAPSPVRDVPQGNDAIPPAPIPEKSTGKSSDLSARECLERAIIAEKDGKPGVARIYYQLAATRGDVFIKAEATRKLEGLK